MRFMNQTTKQVSNREAGKSRASLNAIMRHGGATFQNILWSPIDRQPAERSVNNHGCSLPITLDLLNHNTLGAVSKRLLCHSLPNYVQPIVIYGATPLVSPALEIETLVEIIQVGNSVGVEPQLHTIRITPKHQNSATSATESGFDTLLFCSGLAVGNKPVIIGAAFAGESDRDDLARGALRGLLRQLCADQVALSDIIQRCLQLPQLARVLIDADTGSMIWRNQVASSQWDACAGPIKYLAQIRSTASGAEVKSGIGQRLTLITLLRPKTTNADSDPALPFAKNYELSDGVRTRLTKVIEDTLSQEINSATNDESSRSSALGVIKSMESFGDNNRNDIAHTNEDADAPAEEVEQFESARRALEVALRYLPEGGHLKLSPINSKGEARVESFDSAGEETVDITVKDREFPDSDEIL